MNNSGVVITSATKSCNNKENHVIATLVIKYCTANASSIVSKKIRLRIRDVCVTQIKSCFGQGYKCNPIANQFISQWKMSDERRQSIEPSLLGRRNSRLRFTSDSVTSENRSDQNLSLIKYHYTEILKLIGEYFWYGIRFELD